MQSLGNHPRRPGAHRAFTLFHILLLASLGSWAVTAAAAENWPQWRGPMANGVAPNANPPLEWSESKNVQWKVEVPGSGTSTPIIWENQIFLLAAINTGRKGPEQNSSSDQPPARDDRFGTFTPSEIYQFVLLSLDRRNGQIQWQKTAVELVPHEGHHRDHGFASASPVTDGQHVLAYFGSRGLYCYDLKGDLKWSKDFGDMSTRIGFGEGTSPALHGDVVVINWDHEGEDFIAALNKNTGEEMWRKDRDERTTWTTPLIVEHGGRAQVIVSAAQAVRSYDLRTGEQIWESGALTDNPIPSPVAGHGMVYAMSGFRGSQLYAIKLGATGRLAGTDAVAWSHDRATPYVPSPLLYGDNLYFHKGNDNFISCFDARTGEEHYSEERLQGIRGIYASPVGAADRVYVIGRDGAAVVLKHGDELEVLASNKLDDNVDASPAIVGNQLFVRGHRFLYCLAE